MTTLTKEETLEYARRVGHAFALAVFCHDQDSRLRVLEKSTALLKIAGPAIQSLADDEVVVFIEDSMRSRIVGLRDWASALSGMIEWIENDSPVIGSGTDEVLRANGIKTVKTIAELHQALVDRYSLNN